MAKRWSKQQENALRDGIGVVGWQTLTRRCGARSKAAIRQQAQRRFQAGLTRGGYSARQIARETGYSLSQLRRAAEALNQRWAKTAPGGVYLITHEQQEDMVAWLASDYWSKPLKLYRCLECGTVDAPHHRFGLCAACYARLRRRLAPLQVSASPKALRAWIVSRELTGHRVQRILLNLDKRRAPTLADLDHLLTR